MGHISQCSPGDGLGSTAADGHLGALRRTNQGIGPGIVGNIMALMLIRRVPTHPRRLLREPGRYDWSMRAAPVNREAQVCACKWLGLSHPVIM
jgi:hypothetical protein